MYAYCTDYVERKHNYMKISKSFKINKSYKYIIHCLGDYVKANKLPLSQN